MKMLALEVRDQVVCVYPVSKDEGLFSLCRFLLRWLFVGVSCAAFVSGGCYFVDGCWGFVFGWSELFGVIWLYFIYSLCGGSIGYICLCGCFSP